MQAFYGLTLLHSEKPKLYTILAFLSAKGLKWKCSVYFENVMLTNIMSSVLNTGALVAQWVKHWPTDLAVPGSSPT